mmetsp:Transcript_48895/g.126875  ORF Transcript_48895/g.126875 Transcript_48895/m.126875 type:complete len:251 (-) Transcript_48895:643-1395(-)
MRSIYGHASFGSDFASSASTLSSTGMPATTGGFRSGSSSAPAVALPSLHWRSFQVSRPSTTPQTRAPRTAAMMMGLARVSLEAWASASSSPTRALYASSNGSLSLVIVHIDPPPDPSAPPAGPSASRDALETSMPSSWLAWPRLSRKAPRLVVPTSWSWRSVATLTDRTTCTPPLRRRWSAVGQTSATCSTSWKGMSRWPATLRRMLWRVSFSMLWPHRSSQLTSSCQEAVSETAPPSSPASGSCFGSTH